jgi:hypothetical protein
MLKSHRTLLLLALLLALLLPLPAGGQPAPVEVRVEGATDATRPKIRQAVLAFSRAILACRRYGRAAHRGPGLVIIRLQADLPKDPPRTSLLHTSFKHRQVALCIMARVRSRVARLRGFQSAVVRLKVRALGDDGPVQGDTRTRVFHYAGCRRHGCKRCTARFSSALAAVRAGYRPHRSCTPPGARVPPIPRAEGRRTCRRDKDCGLLPLGPCGCPPCRYSWRSAAPMRMVQSLRARHNAMGACAQRSCRPCEGGYLGSRAVCVRGRCEVRP